MYTYIITCVIAIIVISCIFKSRENDSKKYFTAFLISFIVLFSIGISVTLLRYNHLPIVDVVDKKMPVNQINVGKDTLYIVRDTVKNDCGLSINTQQFDTLPIGKKYKMFVKNVTKGATFLSYISFSPSGIKRDSVIAISYDKDIIYFNRNAIIHEAEISYVEEHSLNRVGDKWTIGWAIPSVDDFFVLYLCKDDIEYLKSINSKLLSQWKIASR